jgi:hypothetical protein
MSLSVHGFVLVSGALIQLLGHQATLLGGVMSVDVVGLHLRKVELLWTEDRSWSSDSYPAYEALCWDLEVLHGPQSDKSSCSTESSLAVDGNSTVIWSFKMFLNHVEEISYDLVWWCGSINEEEILMRDTSILEMLFIIFFLVKSNDFGHINALKDIAIFVWMVSISLSMVPVLNWAHEGNELSWDDPVEISILNSLIVLVLLDIESSEVVPSEPDSILETLKAVEKCAVVEAVTL